MKHFNLILLSLFTITATACTMNHLDEQTPIDINTGNQNQFEFHEGMIVVGKKLQDPFTVQNMRNALNNLPVETRSGLTEDDITATHYYVKFKPKNDEEYCRLKHADTTIMLFPYPLDCELEPGGTYYHDPSLPDDVPTYQYASVEIDHQLPDFVEYEILSELFLPNDTGVAATRSLTEEFTDALMREAYKLTNNEYDVNDDTESGTKTRSWSCSGTIRAYDDLVGAYIPLEGARVCAREWYQPHYTYTNSSGHYNIGTVSGRVYYSIFWERYGKYDIRDGSVNQAVFNGPHQSGIWNQDIGAGKSIRFATINRAVNRYYFGNVYGLKQLTNSFENLKVSYMDKSGGDSSGVYLSDVEGGGLSPDILIYGKHENGIYRNTHEIISTTYHELGHANHCMQMGNIQYWQVDKIIYESWARFVQALLSYTEYINLGVAISSINNYINSYSTFYNINQWPNITYLDYSPIFIDLYDDYNQRIERSNATLPNDNIYGYSATTLNDILLQSYGLTSLKHNLQANKPTGVTDAMISDFIQFYADNK